MVDCVQHLRLYIHSIINDIHSLANPEKYTTGITKYSLIFIDMSHQSVM